MKMIDALMRGEDEDEDEDNEAYAFSAEKMVAHDIGNQELTLGLMQMAKLLGELLKEGHGVAFVQRDKNNMHVVGVALEPEDVAELERQEAPEH